MMPSLCKCGGAVESLNLLLDCFCEMKTFWVGWGCFSGREALQLDSKLSHLHF